MICDSASSWRLRSAVTLIHHARPELLTGARLANLAPVSATVRPPRVRGWQNVADDEGVKKKASEFNLGTVSSAEFTKLVGSTGTGIGSQ